MYIHIYIYIWMDGLSDGPPRWRSVKIRRALSPPYPVFSIPGFEPSVGESCRVGATHLQACTAQKGARMSLSYTHKSRSPYCGKHHKSRSPHCGRNHKSRSPYCGESHKSGGLPYCGKDHMSGSPCCSKTHKSGSPCCGKTTSPSYLIAVDTTSLGHLVAVLPQVQFILLQ